MDLYTKANLEFLRCSFARLATYLEVLEGPLHERLQTPESKPADYAEAVDFLNQVRQSFLVTLISQAELWLIRNCRAEAKLRGIDWQHNWRCNPFEEAKNFYRKELGDPFEFGEHKEWDKVKGYYRVRNCIVHRHGSLTGFSDQLIDRRLEKFIDQEAGLSVQGTGKEIHIEYVFCQEALKTVYKLLYDMFHSLRL
jgi:hypothetical protein